MKFIKLLGILFVGLGLLITSDYVLPVMTGALASNNPLGIPSVSSVAQLKALGTASAQYPTILVNGYNSGSLLGGGLWTWISGSTVASDSCTVLQATGVSTGRWEKVFQNGRSPTGIDPIECGAYGDGAELSAVTNGTTTVTSTSMNCPVWLSEGLKLVFVPAIGTSNAQVSTTIASCNSTTSAVVANSVWSSSSATMWVGHDDGTAVAAAISFANVLYSRTLYLSRPNYLVTSLPNGLGSVEASIIGTGTSTPSIDIAGLSSGADGVSLNSFEPIYSNFGINCMFGGLDCVEWASAVISYSMNNVTITQSNRDGLTWDTADGIESGTVTNLNIEQAGRNCIMANLGSGGFVNISKISNMNCRGASDRVAGGACFYGANSGGNFNAVTFDTIECDAVYGTNGSGQDTYLPSPNPFYLYAGSYQFGLTNLIPENTGGNNPCSTSCSDLFVRGGFANLRGTFCSLAGGGGSWAGNGVDGCVDSFGVLPSVTNGTTVPLLQGVPNNGMNGIITITNTCGSASSTGRWSALGVGSGTPALTQIGSTVTINGGATFTPSISVISTLTSIEVENTCGSTSTAISWYYISQGEGLMPPYWNTN